MSITHPAAILPLKVVAVYGEEIVAGTAVARAGRALGDELRARSFEVIWPARPPTRCRSWPPIRSSAV